MVAAGMVAVMEAIGRLMRIGRITTIDRTTIRTIRDTTPTITIRDRTTPTIIIRARTTRRTRITRRRCITRTRRTTLHRTRRTDLAITGDVSDSRMANSLRRSAKVVEHYSSSWDGIADPAT